MLVHRGIRVIPYFLYEPIKKKRRKKTKQREQDIISLHTLFICLCVCMYACAISSLRSLVLLTSNNIMLMHVDKKKPQDLPLLCSDG